MTQETEKYVPFGKEWEKEMNRIPKKTLVKMFKEKALVSQTYLEALLKIEVLLETDIPARKLLLALLQIRKWTKEALIKK